MRLHRLEVNIVVVGGEVNCPSLEAGSCEGWYSLFRTKDSRQGFLVSDPAGSGNKTTCVHRDGKDGEDHKRTLLNNTLLPRSPVPVLRTTLYFTFVPCHIVECMTADQVESSSIQVLMERPHTKHKCKGLLF